MKRQTALAVAAAPVLVLSLAIAAQAVPSDEPSAPVTETSPAEATEDPSEGASPDTSTDVPTDPATDSTDPTAVPTDDAPATDAPSGPVQTDEGAAASVEPNAALPDAELPDAVAPAEGDLERPADPALGTADVQITLASTDLVAGAVLASGYVTEVEEGGTCSLTLTRGSEVLTIEAPAEADATTTVCGGLTMTTTGLALGEWSATIGYDSSTRSGVSAATTVTIR